MKATISLCEILLVLVQTYSVAAQCEECIQKSTSDSSGVVSLQIDDKFTYEGANSTITVQVYNETKNETANEKQFTLCYVNMKNNNEVVPIYSNLKTKESKVVKSYMWAEAGHYRLILVAIVDEADHICIRNVTLVVAEIGRLELTVTVSDDLNEDSITQIESTEEQFCTGGSLAVGNITFHSTTNLSSLPNHRFHYTYIFGDFEKKDTTRNDSTISHDYNETGIFDYEVQVIGLVNTNSTNYTDAYYTVVRGNVTLLDAVADIDMFINKNHSVKVSSLSDVKISSSGSRPISVEWNITRTNDTKVFGNSSTILGVNETEDFVSIQFPNVVGEYQFDALFYNDANCVNGTFRFSVVQGPSPAVVASSATAVTVLAILIAFTIVLLLIAGGCIPYRRYKNRLTETANFKFIELSDSGNYLKKLKVRTHQIKDRVPFIRQQQAERVGLVLPTKEQELLDPVYSASGATVSFNSHET